MRYNKCKFIIFKFKYIVKSKGKSLKELIEENKVIDHEEIYKWSKHIIYGLDYLNQKKIIHKDINPRYL